MTPSTATTRRRVALLTAQAAALGLVIAWITVPANTIFLQTYGSGLLPVTYILSAGVGAVASVLLSRALRRRALATVAMRVMIASSIGLTIAWLALWLADAAWMSFALLVVLPITIPVGFMFVVGQAGALLDVRSLKVMYPRVIAGFAAGFAIGGLSGAPLLDVLGGAEHLLSTAAVSALVLVALVLVTMKAFAAELLTVETVDESDKTTRPSLRSLLRNRYVVLIMVFQMLSAIESQLLDFLVYDHAGLRYSSSTDLATFVGRFSAIAYGADIVFLIILAGLLMGRFGLRFGLFANPAFVLTLVGASVAGAVMHGSASTIVFLLVVATRVSDMVLADGTTRTSVGAAYQAVPSAQRTASQAVVESLAVPLAIGVSGGILLVVRVTVGTKGLAIPLIVVVTLALWIVCALGVYRGYGVNLLDTLRHRQLDPSDIVVDDAETLIVVEALLASDDRRDVRLGLAALQRSGHPSLVEHLEGMVASERDGEAAMALQLLAEADPLSTAVLARTMLRHPRADVRAAALRTISAAATDSDAERVTALLLDADRSVRLAAANAVGQLSDTAARRGLGDIVASGARDHAAHRRVEAAEMLAAAPALAVKSGSIIEALLADPEPEVAAAALGAVAWPEHEHLEATVVAMLDGRDTASAAVAAIVRAGDRGVAMVDRCLTTDVAGEPRRHELAVRAARDIGTSEAASMLVGHVDHRNRDVGFTIINALTDLALDDSSLATTISGDVVVAEIDHALRILRALGVLEHADCSELRRALVDELTDTRARVMSALSLHHGREAIDRVSFQFAQSDRRQHAIALEWLEVTLVPRCRPAIAILEPDLSIAERMSRLAKINVPSALSPAEQLADLALDQQRVWRRPWLRACALLALSREGSGLPEPLEQLSLAHHEDDPEGIVAETVGALRRRSVAQHS